MILLVGLGVTFFLLQYYQEIGDRLWRVEKIAKDSLTPAIGKLEKVSLIQEIEKEISAPPPLRALIEAPSSMLTEQGVLQWTNIQRTRNGLAPLTGNTRLNGAASSKLQDMFTRQYFEHVSPSGEDAGDLAQHTGYEFLAIGENLALGNYADDQTLVQAWMDSPGHRANILNIRYQEIGVAVGKGIFEGNSTWLAVQIFGLPLSACPQPDEQVKTQVELYEAQASESEERLETMKMDLELGTQRGVAYNRKVQRYNDLVEEYNALARQIKVLVVQYNAQVTTFNECATLQP